MAKFRKYAITFLLCALLCGTTVFATSDSFDSSTDPLVSLSYINEIVIPDLSAQIQEAKNLAQNFAEKADKSALEAANVRIQNLEKELEVIKETVDSFQTTLNKSTSYEVLRLTYGQKLMSKEYSLEIILRTGEVEVISPFTNENGGEYVQGIADLTLGEDIKDGTSIAKNHLIVVPKGGDGRGIIVTGQEAYILVRGAYEIVE